MFANSSMPGIDLAFPDVCNTPAGPAVVPIPYPNIATKIMAIPPTANMRHLLTFMPSHNVVTTVPTSMGDTTGVLLGVASGLIMGPDRNTKCSIKMITGATPATRMLDTTLQNSTNAPPGVSLVPGQFKVIYLS